MIAGRLDRTISILRKRLALSPSGDQVESWEPIVISRAASIAPLSGDERFTSEQYVALEQAEFRIRWSAEVADINPLDRIVSPALRLSELEGSPAGIVTDDSIADRRQYDVMAVHELGRREGLRILAARRVDAVELEDLL